MTGLEITFLIISSLMYLLWSVERRITKNYVAKIIKSNKLKDQHIDLLKTKILLLESENENIRPLESEKILKLEYSLN